MEFKTYRELRDYSCPVCGGSGFVEVQQGEYKIAKECECRQIKINADNILRSGLTEVIDALTFGNFAIKNKWQQSLKKGAIEYTQAILKRDDHWLMVCGSVGCGKTHIATAIMRELLFRGIKAAYFEWRELARTLKAIQFDIEEYDKTVKSLTNYRVLYVDDFMKGAATEADKNVAYDIINTRYRLNLPMIITSEKTHAELSEIDDAIASRIYQKTKDFYYEVVGEGKNMRYGNGSG